MIRNFLLGNHFIYSNFQNFVGAENLRKYLVKKFELKPGDKILDIGCGPADILEYLPENIEYTGFDSNENYINAAKKRFKNRGNFYCEYVDNNILKNNLIQEGCFKVILAIGVLHHLTDEEAIILFELGQNTLEKGGKLITLDGCYTEKQSLLVKFILNMDRGDFVRNEEEYLKLAKCRFNDVKTDIRTNLINIPYTHITMECIKK